MMSNKGAAREVLKGLFFIVAAFLLTLIIATDGYSLSVCESGCDYTAVSEALEVLDGTEGDLEIESAGIYTFPGLRNYKILDNNNNGAVRFNTNNIVLDCNFSGLEGSGSGRSIYIYYQNNITIKNCILNNSDYGVYMYESKNSTLDNVHAYFTDYGARISYSDNVTVVSSEFNNNWEGFRLEYSYDSFVSGNKVHDNQYYGLRLTYAFQNNISNNSLSAGTYSDYSPFYVYASGNNTITNNSIFNLSTSYEYSFRLVASNGNKVYNNRIHNNYAGLLLDTSEGNIFEGNTFYDNEYGFILFTYSGSRYCNNYMDTTNKINGEPIYYLVNNDSYQTPSNAGMIILANSRNITISSFSSDGNYYGILLCNTSHSTIEKSTFLHDYNSIYLYSSFNNNISDNLFSENKVSITLSDSENISIYSNRIHANDSNGYDAISLSSSKDCLISGNLVNASGDGVYVSYSRDIDILNNTLLESNDGINLYSSSNLRINNNTIKDNSGGIYSQNSYNDSFSYNNIFNNSMNIWFYSSADINMEYNYWGSVDDSVISGGIYDFYDWDYYPGKVDFNPALDGMYPGSSVVDVDMTPPDIIFVSPVYGGGVSGTVPMISFNISDKVSGINFSTISARVDNSYYGSISCVVFEDEQSEINCSFISSELSIGFHNLTINATDNSGNLGSELNVFYVDPYGPGVIGNVPANSSTSISRTSNITIYFDDSMDINSFLNYSANIYDSEGEVVRGYLSYDSSENKTVLDPFLYLKHNMTYFIFLSTDILDAAGNRMNSSYSFNFTVAVQDTDGDSTPDYADTDDDNDGVLDSNDNLKGDESDINTNMPGIDVLIDGDSNLAQEFGGNPLVSITNGGTLIVEFSFNFESYLLDLSNLTILENSSNAVSSLIVHGLPATVSSKTLFIRNTTKSHGICIIDTKDVLHYSDFTPACTSDNEMFIVCPGSNASYTCVNNGTNFKITGLSNSAVIQMNDSIVPSVTIVAIGGDTTSSYITYDLTPMVNISLSETAVCKYDIDSDTSYNEMNDSFTSSGSFRHYAEIQNISEGTHSIYIRCNDSYGNYMTSSTSTSFQILRNSTDDSNSSDSSSGDDSPSGGGGGSSDTSSSSGITARRAQMWGTVLEQVKHTMKIDDEDIAVTSIDFYFNKTVDNVKLEVRSLGAKPADVTLPDSEVYQYLEFWNQNMDALYKSEINFRVLNTWFSDNGIDPDKVALLLWTGSSWKTLITGKVSSVGLYTSYETSATDFNYFAVVGKKVVSSNSDGSAASNETEGEVASTTSSSPPTTTPPKESSLESPSDTGNNLISNGTGSMTLWMILLVFVVVILGVTAYFMSDKQAFYKAYNKTKGVMLGKPVVQTPVQTPGAYPPAGVRNMGPRPPPRGIARPGIRPNMAGNNSQPMSMQRPIQGKPMLRTYPGEAKGPNYAGTRQVQQGPQVPVSDYNVQPITLGSPNNTTNRPPSQGGQVRNQNYQRRPSVVPNQAPQLQNNMNATRTGKPVIRQGIQNGREMQTRPNQQSLNQGARGQPIAPPLGVKSKPSYQPHFLKDHPELKEQYQQDMKGLFPYINICLVRGFTKDQILETLVESGWNKDEIEEILYQWFS